MKTSQTALCVALALVLAGCGEKAPAGPKVLIGATLFDTSTRAVVERAVVIVEAERFKAVGDQPTLPIPPGSEKVDLTGRFLIPTPVRLPADARYPRYKTQAELRALVERGQRAVRGVPVDVTSVDADLTWAILEKGVVVFPSLTVFEPEPHNLKRARALAKAMFDSGVRLGVDGADSAHREWKFLSEAGLPAEAIIQATTLHAAATGTDAGRIAAGAEANLYVLKCDPREDISCLVKIERAMEKGGWVQSPSLGEN